jgi:hypothetical protein
MSRAAIAGALLLQDVSQAPLGGLSGPRLKSSEEFYHEHPAPSTGSTDCVWR